MHWSDRNLGDTLSDSSIDSPILTFSQGHFPHISANVLLIILVIENVLFTSRGLFKFDILVCGLPIFVTIFGTIELNRLDYRLDGMQVELRTYVFIISHIHCL